jgi:hypothetical protein
MPVETRYVGKLVHRRYSNASNHAARPGLIDLVAA